MTTPTDPTGRISHLPQMHRGVSWKQPVDCATTGNVTISALVAGYTVDGHTLALNERVLVKDETSALLNGIYLITADGPRRDFDMDQDASSAVPAEEVLGAIVAVIGGTVNAGSLWRCTNTTAVTLGTDAIAFETVGGPSGSPSDSTVPYYIPVATTYTVALYRQALYSHAITVDGALVVDGILIGV